MEKIERIIGRRVLIADGAMGTYLAEKGYGDVLPEEVLLKDYRIVREIHREYISAGADIVITDTFGANREKLKEFSLQDKQNEIIYLAVKAAREAGDGVYVAGSIGPIGTFLTPFGELSHEEAYSIFREMAEKLILNRVDLIVVETMTDIKELKICMQAIRDVSRDIPVILQMSFNQGTRTVTGTPVESFIFTAEALRPIAIGSNCGSSLEDMYSVSKIMGSNSPLPFSIQPNAGLPHLEGDRVVYNSSPDEMAEFSLKFYEEGASIIGSCCGSTPEHTRKIAELLKGKKVRRRSIPEYGARLTSRTGFIQMGKEFIVIGERINPTGKKALKKEIEENRLSRVKKEIILQIDAGVHALDVNISTGNPERERELIKKVIQIVENSADVPLFIDSPFFHVVESALNAYSAKPVVNSITGEEEKMENLMMLTKAHGAGFVALLMDEKGIPESHIERLKILERILKKAEESGFTPGDIIVDPVVMTAGSSQNHAMETLLAIRAIKEDFSLSTVIGLSNISFGLPSRRLLNRVFLSMAMSHGLDSAILNPLDSELMNTIRGAEVITGRDRNAERYVALYSGIKEKKKKNKKLHSLYDKIIHGDEEDVERLTEDYLKDKEPMDMVNNILIKALEEVGEKYERGEYFLPQVIASASVVKKAFAVIKERFTRKEEMKGRIVIATVKGDVHDIGKNIVKTIFESYGYKVYDLGKNVDKDRILEAVIEYHPHFLALSGLLTPSLLVIKETVEYVRSRLESPPFIIVGGAVLNREFAEDIGVFYAKDGLEGIKLIERVLKEEKKDIS